MLVVSFWPNVLDSMLGSTTTQRMFLFLITGRLSTQRLQLNDRDGAS